MTIIFENVELEIRWQHHTCLPLKDGRILHHLIPSTLKQHPLHVESTRCIISDVERDSAHNITGRVPVAEGHAVLSPKDVYNKDTARKVSLTRALQSYPFNKGERAAVWHLYHETMGPLARAKRLCDRPATDAQEAA